MKIPQHLISLFSFCRISFRFILSLPFIIGSFSWLSSSLAKMKKLFFLLSWTYSLYLTCSMVFCVLFATFPKLPWRILLWWFKKLLLSDLIFLHRFSLIAESAEESVLCLTLLGQCCYLSSDPSLTVLWLPWPLSWAGWCKGVYLPQLTVVQGGGLWKRVCWRGWLELLDKSWWNSSENASIPY